VTAQPDARKPPLFPDESSVPPLAKAANFAPKLGNG